MLRLIPLLIVGLTCFACSGCLGLLRAILYPAEVLGSVVESVTYDVASELAGAEQALGSNPDNLANIDRILEEHPDATNRDSLLRLREHLAKEQNPGRDSSEVEADIDRFGGDEPVMIGDLAPWQPENEYDRHRYDDRDKSRSRMLRAPVGRPSMRTSLRVHHPQRPQLTLRHTDSRHHQTVPESSSIEPAPPDYPLMHMQGSKVLQTGLHRRDLLINQ